MPMEYAASIPAHFNESFARDVLNYRKREYDKQIARTLSTIRNVGPTVQKDTITYYEKTGGNDTIAAKITAKGAIPEQVGVKGNEITHNKLADIAGVPKLVPPDNTMITTARNIGISFGD